MSLRCFSVALAFSCLVAVACDPDEDEVDQVLAELAPTPTKADPAKDAADAAAKRVAEAKAAKKAAADDFATCMAGCFGGNVPSPTDRQTCRLTCGADRLAAEGPAASPSVKAALGRFDTCLDADCRKPSSATDSATCRLTCAQAALAGQAALPLAATARECGVSCLEHCGDCDAACRRDGSSEDAATCRLQCLTLGERCLGKCEADASRAPVDAVLTPPAAATDRAAPR
jgi:pyruvate/2-oxoglutarate dehydrogenase complex dihydrolipoamide acyltransferase (E2) component